MKTTEPYSPTARAKASVKPVSIAGSTVGTITRRSVWNRFAPRVAAASSISRVEILEGGLERPHDEGQSDERQREHDAERRIDRLDPERPSGRPIQPSGE